MQFIESRLKSGQFDVAKKQICLNLFKERLNKSSTYLKFECPKIFFVIDNLDCDIELPLPFALVGQLLNINHQVVLGK